MWRGLSVDAEAIEAHLLAFIAAKAPIAPPTCGDALRLCRTDSSGVNLYGEGNALTMVEVAPRKLDKMVHDLLDAFYATMRRRRTAALCRCFAVRFEPGVRASLMDQIQGHLEATAEGAPAEGGELAAPLWATARRAVRRALL